MTKAPKKDRDIAARVRVVLSDLLGVQPENILDSDDLIEELSADSLDLVEITMALEEEFDLEIPDDHAERIHRVADIIAYIDRCTGGLG